MKKVIIFFLLIFLSNAIFASIPYFKILQVDRENNNVHINTLFQDYQSYIWAGTDQGLYRYDGILFSHIAIAAVDSAENITALAEGVNHTLLAGTNNGKIIIENKNQFYEISTPFKAPVKTILQGKDSVLWVATYGEGIFYKNSKGWNAVKGLPDNFIYTIVQHPSGVLLAGTDLGFVIIHPDSLPGKCTVFDSHHGLPDNLVREIYCEADGKIWLGLQEGGICKFDLASSAFTKPDNLKSWNFTGINCMARLKNEFWIGTSASGIVDFEFRGDNRVRTFSEANGFGYTNITDILQSKDGNIWIASGNKLLFSPGEKYEVIASENNEIFDSIHAVANDASGNIWLSNNKGLFRYNYNSAEPVKQFMIEPKFRSLHIVSLYADISGYIWLGTFDDGLFRLEPQTGDVKRYSVNEGIQNANVISINGRDNKMWLATLGGITLCEKNDENEEYKFTNYSDVESPGSVFVYSVFIDKNGRVWFGTDGKGITVYDNGKFTNYRDFDKGKGKVVYSITEDASGNIWFSTLNHGIYKFDGIKFQNFNLTNGLRDLNISSVTNDKVGNIIVIHQRGIDIIHPGTYEWDYVGREVGIESLDCDLNTVTHDYKNNIWIGSQHGIIRFINNPVTVTIQPEIHIQKTYAFMKPGSSLADSVFNYNQNQISFEYIGIYYSNPEAVTYRYRLIGFSNKWINTRDRIVTFPNLPPGKYRFEVAASCNNQFINSFFDHFDFVIQKPLYKETWFIISVCLLISLGLFFFIRDRELRFRRIESLKKEKIVYQFETLKSQVNPHFLFNSFNTLIAIIEDDSKKAVNYVENLSDYFRNMVQHREKDTVLLSEELEMVKTYYLLQKERYGENFSLEFNIPEQWKMNYKLPPLSLQLLIENAVKHNAISHETPLKIKVAATKNNRLLIVNNLNKKLFPDKSTGIGLENLISRFNILSPDPVIILKTETEFKVEIPLI